MPFLKSYPTLLAFLFFTLSASSQFHIIHLEDDENNAIQKIDLYNGKEGYVAFNKWLGFTQDSGKTFIQKPVTLSNVDYNGFPVNLTFGFAPRGVKAFNKDTLLLYGDYGAEPSILYSDDQGATFKLVYWTGLNVNILTDAVSDMAFPGNGNTGYAVQANYILKTTDRGKTWIKNNLLANDYLEYIQGFNNSTLYAFGTSYNGKLYKSINDGSSWMPVNLPALAAQPQRIGYAHFLNSTKGWISVYSNATSAIYYTNDGGETWTAKTNLDAMSYYFGKIHFVNDSTGYALGGEFTVYKTIDSGRVWEPLQKDHSYSYLNYNHTDLFVHDESTWSGGAHGFLQLGANKGDNLIPKAYFLVDSTGVAATGKVQLKNYSGKNYQYRWFVNGSPAGALYNMSYTHIMSRVRDTITLIVTNGILSDTARKIQEFVVPVMPVISGFSPIAGGEGSAITINGTNLHLVNSVKFGGTPVESFTIVSSTVITAVVGNGSSGNVSLNDISSLPGFNFIPTDNSPSPIISGFSPAYAKAGATITINGSNFNSQASSNKVFFGTIAATIMSASANQITCIVPMGAIYDYVHVLNTVTNQQTSSLLPFNVPFFADNESQPNFISNSFLPRYRMDYTDHPLPKDVVASDFDGDGKTDMLVVTALGGGLGDSLRIYRNTSTAVDFSFDLNYATAPGRDYPSVGDVDGDGKPDIVSTSFSQNISISLNTGTTGNISFSSPIYLSGIKDAKKLLIRDVDGDGRNDILALPNGLPRIYIFRNTGTKGNVSFALPVIVTCGGRPRSFAMSDMDLDGKNDIVTYNYIDGSTSNFSFLRNISTPGNINFENTIDFSVSGSAIQSDNLHLVDYDGDNKTDIAILNNDNFFLYKNNSQSGVLSFANPVSFENPSDMPVYMTSSIANLSGSPRPDLASGLWTQKGVVLYKNISTTSEVKSNLPVRLNEDITHGYGFYYTAVGDFNNDGRPDIVGIPSTSNQVGVLFILGNEVGKSGIIKPDVSLTVPSTNFCKKRPVTFTASVSNSPDPYFLWQVNGVTVEEGKSFTNTFNSLNQNDKVRVIATCSVNNCSFTENDTSEVFTMIQTGIIPSVIISGPAGIICNDSISAFTAIVQDAGTNPSYQWQVNDVNAGINSTNFSAVVSNGDKVKLILTGSAATCNDEPVSSNIITANITPTHITGVEISANMNIICPNEAIQVVGSSSTNINNLVYEWKVDGVTISGQTGNLFYYNGIASNSQVQAFITTNKACAFPLTAASNIINIQVRESVVPVVTVTGNTSVDAGKASTLTATVENAGNNLAYNWQDSITSTGWKMINGNLSTLAAYPTATGHKFRCIVSGNDICGKPVTDTSEAVTFTINTVTEPEPEDSNVVVIPRARYYPNPAIGELIIDSIQLSDNWEAVDVYSLSGKLQFTTIIRGQQQVSLPVRSLSPGIYIAVMRRKNGPSVRMKFIKQ